MTTDMLDFYAQAGLMTDPGESVDLLAGLPTEIGALCEIVQNNLVHIFWAERYGLTLTEEDKQTVQIRPVSQKLARIGAADKQPLSVARPLEQRQVGNCRDFSVLLCALLRHQGVPARARCGFGAYFLPGHYEDHWVCEYWNAGEERWIMVDAQLDAFQRQNLNIQFDPLDVPADQFILAGRGWQMCRFGQADPDHFGIFDMHGWWFIWGDVGRDFLALNKVEILPWDGGWGHLPKSLRDPWPDEARLAEYDRIAALTQPGNQAFAEMRATYTSDPRWQIPAAMMPAA